MFLVLSGKVSDKQKSLREEMSAMHFNVWQPITEKEIFLILIWVVKETRTEQELCTKRDHLPPSWNKKNKFGDMSLLLD